MAAIFRVSPSGRQMAAARTRQELRRELAHHFAVERDEARDPEAVEDRKQQQWVFGRFSQGFGLFDSSGPAPQPPSFQEQHTL